VEKKPPLTSPAPKASEGEERKECIGYVHIKHALPAAKLPQKRWRLQPYSCLSPGLFSVWDDSTEAGTSGHKR